MYENTVDCMVPSERTNHCSSAPMVLTQQYAFDSFAHSSGHSRGVMVARRSSAASLSSSLTGSRLLTSSSMVGTFVRKKRLETGSVVDVQLSQSLDLYLYEPVCSGAFSTRRLDVGREDGECE